MASIHPDWNSPAWKQEEQRRIGLAKTQAKLAIDELFTTDGSKSSQFGDAKDVKALQEAFNKASTIATSDEPLADRLTTLKSVRNDVMRDRYGHQATAAQQAAVEVVTAAAFVIAANADDLLSLAHQDTENALFLGAPEDIQFLTLMNAERNSGNPPLPLTEQSKRMTLRFHPNGVRSSAVRPENQPEAITVFIQPFTTDESKHALPNEAINESPTTYFESHLTSSSPAIPPHEDPDGTIEEVSAFADGFYPRITHKGQKVTTDRCHAVIFQPPGMTDHKELIKFMAQAGPLTRDAQSITVCTPDSGVPDAGMRWGDFFKNQGKRVKHVPRFPQPGDFAAPSLSPTFAVAKTGEATVRRGGRTPDARSSGVRGPGGPRRQ